MQGNVSSSYRLVTVGSVKSYCAGWSRDMESLLCLQPNSLSERPSIVSFVFVKPTSTPTHCTPNNGFLWWVNAKRNLIFDWITTPATLNELVKHMHSGELCRDFCAPFSHVFSLKAENLCLRGCFVHFSKRVQELPTQRMKPHGMRVWKCLLQS